MTRLQRATERLTRMVEADDARRLQMALDGRPIQAALLGLVCLVLTIPTWIALVLRGE